MKKITKSDPQLQQVQHFAGAIFFLPAIITAGYCFMAGFNLLPVNSEALALLIKQDSIYKYLLSNSPKWDVILIGFYFFIAAVIVFIKIILSWINKRKRIFLAKQYNQTCFLDYPWNPKGIHDRTGKIWVNSLFSSIMFSTIIIPLNWYTFFMGGADSWIVLTLAIIFDLAMIIVLYGAVYYCVYAILFGNNYISFTSFPFFPGGKMSVIFSRNRFKKLKFTLRFLKEVFEEEDFSDDAKSIICYELYCEQKIVHCSTTMSNVPVSFHIPETNPAWVNQLNGTSSIYYWELEVETEQPLIDFHTSFLVPIYEQ